MDIRDIFVLTALASGTCGVALLLHPSDEGAKKAKIAWSTAYALLGVGWACLAARAHLPLALSVIVANVALYTGFSYTIIGLNAFVGRSAQDWVVPSTAVLTLILFGGLVFADPERGDLRIAVSGALAAIIAGYAAWILHRDRHCFFESTRAILLTAYVAIAVLSFGRIVAGFSGRAEVDLQKVPLSTAIVFATYAVLTIALAFTYMRLLSLDVIARLERQSREDLVSGAHSRAYFEISLELEIERAKRFDLPLALILFDIDHFKDVNDTYGHTVGDRYLRFVVDRAGSVVRSIDTVARFGGDEFAVILPGTGRSDAYRIAERLRAGVAVNDDADRTGIPLSVGVATYSKGEDMDSFVKRADEALYAAKRGGRGRTCLAGEAKETVA